MSQRHAVVIGGSMAGLVAARVLSRHFDKVTILDRDTFPDAPVPRKGVPQGRHTHGLLARGREVLEKLFPGLTSELVRDGAIIGDVLADVAWFNDGMPLAQAPSALEGLLASRPLIEAHLRRRLTQIQNVEIKSRCEVEGLVTAQGAERVTGVAIKSSGETATIAADLVVDASGRGSQSPTWLRRMGYAPPAETKVEVGITYLTRTFRRRPGQCSGTLGVVVAGSAPNWRNGAMLVQEGDRWIVSIGGFFGDAPPRDEAGFLAFARTLPAPQFAEVAAGAEPIDDFASYGFPASLRRHYEAVKRFPQGFLVLGDALASFNPVYGQGMTVAALEGLALDACLAAGEADLARRFFKRAAPIVDTAWSIAVGNDLRHAKVVGRRSLMVRFVNWYVGRLTAAAVRDPLLGIAFLRVANLMAPPTSLLKPDIAWAVFRGRWRRGAAIAVAAAEVRKA